ncbi:TPR repeat-containing protein [Tolypothrix sp. NIES-4075]|uniref:O-linked N-acetylglucosamine transferase, SPINDLY family protein n=1 Tax=Tolypothrix sp. NIES-4075 TaxID=2005459 RepID=UPI000B5C6C2D|nr:O-linked N-acetylglucosamine transferase, SPINDLY family protein [Tolypothrix sp. NIES-4075]GAX41101.1 TPR repeat-containing protein [Tolypothrix sp. NIES-4075]
MTLNSSLTNFASWQQQAEECLIQSDYYKAAIIYEQAIEAEPEVKSYYWHLGLMLLLHGQEAEAQTTWLMAMMEGEPEQIELWNEELALILKAEAERRSALADRSTAYLLRHHLGEIQRKNVNNLLHLIQLSIELETFTADELASWEIIELLRSKQPGEVDVNHLMQVLQLVLDCDPLHPLSRDFAEACLLHLEHFPKYFAVVLVAAINVAYSLLQPTQAVKLAELCQRIDAEDLELLRHLAAFYQNSGDYTKGIEIAKKCYSLLKPEALSDRVFANHLMLRGLMYAGGYREEAQKVVELQESLLRELVEQQPILNDCAQISRLLISTFFLPYLRDDLKQNRKIQNQVAALCQSNLQNYANEQAEWYKKRRSLPSKKREKLEKPLKIGYLSNCLRQHSVGWLARWLFEYHNRDRFEIYGYFVNYKQKEDPLQEWYANQVNHAHKMGIDSREIAEKISQDEIDILIDLDSLTLDISCEVMALKPALIQATWLGWDASGIPAVDYFIADPYVLPDDAQNYYSEKIWRLPQTYIAVDGFEVGVPTLRREHLNIPSDAIVYLSAQGGCKRHPDTIRLQMRILKAVPNSYFLIKGLAEEEAIKSFFDQIANEEGVDSDRLRFLPMVRSEAIHRANLSLADVVLDTYPYNGATTTLETLWVGIPLVTRVGEQFAARNSYTMMMNAGITQGIAWTDEEYVDWGIRLGKDSALRQKIAWQLQQSRHTAPLWNAEQFTQQMEKAYREMWQIYLDT